MIDDLKFIEAQQSSPSAAIASDLTDPVDAKRGALAQENE